VHENKDGNIFQPQRARCKIMKTRKLVVHVLIVSWMQEPKGFEN